MRYCPGFTMRMLLRTTRQARTGGALPITRSALRQAAA
jgi:hypothetical protein